MLTQQTYLQASGRAPKDQRSPDLSRCTRGPITLTTTASSFFPDCARGVLIYEQYLPLIPAHTPVENYLEGELDFEEMFEVLYPPLMTGANHGIDLRWEIQLVHPLFVDQELVCPCAGLAFADFTPKAR